MNLENTLKVLKRIKHFKSIKISNLINLTILVEMASSNMSTIHLNYLF